MDLLGAVTELRLPGSIGGYCLPGAGVGFMVLKPRKGSLKWSQRWG